MSTIVLHDYNGFAISQESNGYVSLTDMAKASGKLVADYLRLDTTKAYLEALSMDINTPVSALVKVVQGKGKKQGTWAHPEVASRFSQW
jgi:KilA-N domain.